MADEYEDYLVRNKRPGDREVPAREGKSDSERKDQSRPPMQQDSHPEHNMPASEHNGVVIKANDGGAP